jgi:hypothetical protein
MASRLRRLLMKVEVYQVANAIQRTLISDTNRQRNFSIRCEMVDSIYIRILYENPNRGLIVLGLFFLGDQEVHMDLQQRQGTWRAVRIKLEGNYVPEEVAQTLSYIFKDDRVVLLEKDAKTGQGISLVRNQTNGSGWS